jgi:hypothetical protein
VSFISYWFWRCNHVWLGSSKLVISVSTSSMTTKMNIDIALIYWYYVSWSFVGCIIFGYYTLGCHAPTSDDSDYGAPNCTSALNCTNALDYDVMVGPRKNLRPWRANCSLTCRLEASWIVSDNKRCASVSPMAITTSHTLWLCRWL